MAVPGIFITGTDTGVGKTIIAAALAHILRQRGRTVGVIKPVATGCTEQGGMLVSDDALLLARAAGVNHPHDLICPIRLRRPLAPMVAAELDGQPIDLSIARAAIRRLAALHDFLIIEGIGGIMVPLTDLVSVADFAAELGAPLLIVGRAGLGAINHTLLTVEHARTKGLHIAAIVLNHPAPADPGLAEQTNPAAIARLTGIPVIGPVPYTPGISTDDAALAGLADRFLQLKGAATLIATLLDRPNG